MNLDVAITRHRKALLRIVVGLFTMAGLVEGGTVERLSWPLYRAVLRVLRPAEAAVRRLIIIAARDLVVTPSPTRAASKGKARTRAATGTGTRRGRVLFQLFDPRKRFNASYSHPTPQAPPQGAWPEPRIRVLGFDPTWRPWHGQVSSPALPPPPQKDPTTVSAASLCRRLLAIKAALEDIAHQARRYARWRAKPVEKRRLKRTSPLRPGSPPGFRKKPTHEVHAILSECHWLAREAEVVQPNTS